MLDILYAGFLTAVKFQAIPLVVQFTLYYLSEGVA